MTAWLRRPREEANLLNPAFCCLGIGAAVIGFQSEGHRGMPFPLAHMALPIVLHKPTRELLPRDRRTSLPMWIQENASVRVLFYERLMALKPHTREAILFGCEQRWMNVDGTATLTTDMNETAIRRAVRQLSDEPKDCVMKALFLGKWFAAVGSAPTVMALWGIQL